MSKETSKEMSFEEYCEREYSGLKVLLSGFPEEEIKAYWDSEMDFIKSAYKTKSRIAYGLALAFSEEIEFCFSRGDSVDAAARFIDLMI